MLSPSIMDEGGDVTRLGTLNPKLLYVRGVYDDG